MAAVWPRFRRWAGPGPMLIALAALVLTPLSTRSGEYLEHRLPSTAAIEKHAWLGKQLLPWVAALAVVAAAGTTVQVVRIGHSGAQAAWSEAGKADPSNWAPPSP